MQFHAKLPDRRDVDIILAKVPHHDLWPIPPAIHILKKQIELTF
jgi:hypothetical protein